MPAYTTGFVQPPGAAPLTPEEEEEQNRRADIGSTASTLLSVTSPVVALGRAAFAEDEPAAAAAAPKPGQAPPVPGVGSPAQPTPVTPPAIPGSGTAAAPLITQRGPGGTSVQLPLTGGTELEQSTSRGSTTRSSRTVSKEERQAQADQEAVAREQVKNAEEKKKVLIDAAREEQTSKDALQAVAAAKQQDADQRLQAYEAEIKRRQSIADQTETEYKAQLQDFQQTDPRKRFWAKQDTGEKLTAGLSMLLGIVGGLKDGTNVGAERILKAIDADTARAREVLEAKERMVDRTRGDVTTAKNDIARHKDLIDLRSAVAKERVLAEADARAAKLGIPKAAIEGNEGILKIRESAAADRLKLEQSRATQVQNEQSWSRVSTNAGGGPAGQDKPLAKWSGAEKEAEGFAQRMHSAAQQMDQFKYNPRDLALIRREAGFEGSLGPKANAVRQFITGRLFEQLSPEGKKRWVAEQEFARANLRRESGAAISIGETLAETESVGERPGDTPETLGMKKQQRALKVRATGIASGRPTYWDGITRETATQAAVGAPPAGARPGKVNGKPAWIFPDNTYELR
jgi:hypothetical protein